ncbi:helicase c2 [Xylanimonas cellulosilytica DSM 15894]|uniref:ATP-dependent helicase DinG n=1 Tax=Xylanimonas cellulosilytica (strain DSM 15894 / JCM 12276 / CECT 5975 / KCTC 9989 / LMG 20990 / NBRC 107835 / XIL07) TaxID=446471 RepID=D1C098_XYLCX|nr:ATP-dependent DNA helicase [Xylanimonas cellulosilytica]ACZ30287.1 helicase c2 [Xylanimonas cellulosilytica DSM 15894]
MTSEPALDADAAPDAGGVPGVEALLDLAVGRLGGGRREGQHAMALEVVEAIDEGRHLLVQAGTGTGKSLGYLVPAVRHAVVADERVIVSTATLALQRQVITRDLPLVADAVAPQLPRPPRIALLKGWHNYLCLHKTGGGYPVDDATLFDLPGITPGESATEHPAEAPGRARREDGAASLADQVRRLHAWAHETDSGDRDELVPGVPDRAWRQVSVTSLECLGQRCPLLAECFPERARAAAREADVVVTNHAMLGIAVSGSPGVLPEHGVVVVDEAHELADRATSAATVDLSLTTIEHAARLARRHAAAETTALDAAAQELGSLIAQAPAGSFPLGLPEDLRTAVGAVRDALRELLTRTKPDPPQGGAAPDGGAKMAQSAVLQVYEVAERMAAEDSSSDVLWCSRPGDGPGAGWGDGVSRLHAAPLHVAGLIRAGLLAETTGIFTSATLALGGQFDAVAGSLGLGRTDDDGGRWRGVDVGSPFDYPRQGILYVARHLPAPGRDPATDAQLDEIAGLIEAAGGRTLGLFSSRRAANAVAEAMRERLDVPVLAQGDDQLPTLVRQFAQDPATCLFGTISLWQGVDVPGPACQLVIIDRIPFPRPDDPVKAARARAVEKAGGNGFMAVSATHAALLLAQGAGRLIRATEDRGVVAVLDPRLATARYGTFLTRSMPNFWPTTDGRIVREALRRLATPEPAA